jgi:hypothetical protein
MYAVVTGHTLGGSGGPWCLEAANQDLAEKIVYLNGMVVNKTDLKLRRHQDYRDRDPKPALVGSWDESLKKQISREKMTTAASATDVTERLKHPCCVFLKHYIPNHDVPTTQLVNFLHGIMKAEGLLVADDQNNALLFCNQCGGSSSQCWLLMTNSEDQAEKLLYLNGIQFHDGSKLLLSCNENFPKPLLPVEGISRASPRVFCCGQ